MKVFATWALMALVLMSVAQSACGRAGDKEVAIYLIKVPDAKRPEVRMDGALVRYEDLTMNLRKAKFDAGETKVSVLIAPPADLAYMHVSPVIISCLQANLHDVTIAGAGGDVKMDLAALAKQFDDERAERRTQAAGKGEPATKRPELILRLREGKTTVSLREGEAKDLSALGDQLKTFDGKEPVRVSIAWDVAVGDVLTVVRAMRAAKLEPIVSAAMDPASLK